jgi:O-antigen/teichoic acid export membrane protein
LFTKIQTNYFWLVLEKIIGIVGLFFINALVAKYVGPLILGQIAFATAIFQIIQVIGVFGSDNILYKRASTNFDCGLQLLNPIFALRNILYFIFSFIGIIFLNLKMDHTGFVLSISVCVAYYFYTIDSYSSLNDLTLNSRLNAIANVIGLLIGLILRSIMVHYRVSPLYFGVPLIVISGLPYLLKLYLFNFKKRDYTYLAQKKFKKRFLCLFQTGSVLVFPTIISAIYPRLNILIISYIYGDKYVGIYSVSQMIATSWSFILLSLLTSCLPSLFKERSNITIINTGAKLHLQIIALAIPVILIMSLVINYVIIRMYGVAYTGAVTPCIILCIATLLSVLGTASTKIIIRLSGYKFLLYKTMFILVLSLILSYILSMRFNLVGAAFAIVLTELFSLTVINYLFRGGFVLLVHIEMLKIIKRSLKSYISKLNN